MPLRFTRRMDERKHAGRYLRMGQPLILKT